MKNDVLAWAGGRQPSKVVSKETLNHPGLIQMVSGLDVFQHTPMAYLRAYEALGIDIINRVPRNNAPPPTPQGQTRQHPTRPYWLSHLGVFDTSMRVEYACRQPEDVWNLDMNSVEYDDLFVPVPHGCRQEDIRLREKALGKIGLYYPMLYTTLFMWAVEVLGWENFMIAAATEPKRFGCNRLSAIRRVES